MNIHDYGFYRVAAIVPPCAVGDCTGNAERIIGALRKSAEMGADIAVFPALALTSASCGTFFEHRSLLNAAEDRLAYIVRSRLSVWLVFHSFFRVISTVLLPSSVEELFTALYRWMEPLTPAFFPYIAEENLRQFLPVCKIRLFRSVPICCLK